jgi:hypothetical protein
MQVEILPLSCILCVTVHFLNEITKGRRLDFLHALKKSWSGRLQLSPQCSVLEKQALVFSFPFMKFLPYVFNRVLSFIKI